MVRTFDDLFEDLRAAMQRELAAQAEPTRPKTRYVSKMAKNIQHGEVAVLPGIGPVEISAWSLAGGFVRLGDGGLRNATVAAEDRLRVQRGAGACAN